MVDRTDGLLYETGQGYSQLDAQSARDRLDGYAVVSGLDVSPGGSLSVDVTAGEAIVGTDTNGDTITVSPGSTQTVSLAAADSANPRKDTVWIDDTGTAQVATGTAETALPEGNSRFNTFQPEPPFPAGDGTILAEVCVAAGATSLTSADIRDRRQPADYVGESIQTATAEHEAVNTEHLVNDYHYAGAYDGADADARLDNALSASSTGDTIYLENEVYSTTRTVPIRRKLVGAGTWPSDSTTIATTWTLAEGVVLHGVSINGDDGGELVVSDNNCKYINSHATGASTVTVNADFFICTQHKGLDVTFSSGTTGGIVDSSTDTSVTDNGSNTVGDIA